MRRNVEIKARVSDLEPICRRARELATDPPVWIEQEDTFFPCAEGRLKVRCFPDASGELIFYRRSDSRGPVESRFLLAPLSDAKGVAAALTAAHGTCGVVRKRRELYLVGATRVHLDRVEGLGEFVELEVVLEPDQTTAEGVAEAERLMDRLGIPREGLVEAAYVDLLEQGEKSWN